MTSMAWTATSMVLPVAGTVVWLVDMAAPRSPGAVVMLRQPQRRSESIGAESRPGGRAGTTAAAPAGAVPFRHGHPDRLAGRHAAAVALPGLVVAVALAGVPALRDRAERGRGRRADRRERPAEQPGRAVRRAAGAACAAAVRSAGGALRALAAAARGGRRRRARPPAASRRDRAAGPRGRLRRGLHTGAVDH